MATALTNVYILEKEHTGSRLFVSEGSMFKIQSWYDLIGMPYREDSWEPWESPCVSFAATNGCKMGPKRPWETK